MGGYGSGRRSRPTEVKKLTGAEPRRINDHEAQYERLTLAEPPADFSVLASQLWEHYTPKLIRSGVLTSVDLPAFRELCLAGATMQEAEDRLQKEGRVVYHGDKETVSPWHRIQKDARIDFFRLCARFGLTPADRANLVVPEDNSSKTGEDPSIYLT